MKPTENFYEYVNEKWFSENKLPDGYSTWGNFQILDKKSYDSLKQIIHELSQEKNLSKENEFLVNLYKNYLDDDNRTKTGIQPIIPVLEMIDNWEENKTLTKLFIELEEKWGFDFFHSKYINAYFKDSNVRALTIDTMSLGMDNCEFYNPKHPRHQEIKQAYQTYIESLVNETKVSFNTTNLFNLVYNFEDELAKVMFKQEELRDPKNIYNEMTIDQLNELANFIDWTEYLHYFGYDKAAKVVVTQPKYFKKITELINQTSQADLQDLMKYFVLTRTANLLTPKLYDIAFEYGSVFSGVKIKKPAEDRAIRFTNALLGELLSKEYIKKNFSENAKQDVLGIVAKLREKFALRIQDLDWMSSATKQKALEKLEAITVKIGYPDKWEDFSDLEIKTYEQQGNLFENLLSIQRHHTKKELQDIDKPVDRDKWYMYAQTVNAYYNPQTNEICFPAGILQAPFYDEKAPRATNLGGIGSVIGHEVGHGFDDEGSQYDKDGNFENWWTEEDYQQYRSRTNKVVEEYDQFTVNGNHVNGKLTLGENIGDLTGVTVALDIAKEEVPQDLNLFFENYGRVFCTLITPEAANTRLLIDPHSPGEFRCNGVVVNLDEFHQVYQTQPGDGMYKPEEDRIKIW